MSTFYKTGLMPIEVCIGDYCWDGKRVCGHFDNEGGHGSCDLGMDHVARDETGYYPKPKECLELENENESIS